MIQFRIGRLNGSLVLNIVHNGCRRGLIVSLTRFTYYAF